MTSVAGFEITRFMPRDASPQEWSEYHTLRRALHDEVDPDDPFPPDESAEIAAKNEHPLWFEERYQVRADGRLVARFGLGGHRPGAPGWDTNAGLLEGGGSILRAYRRRGIGRAMLAVVADFMDRHEGRIFTTGGHEPDGYAFLEAHGFQRKFGGRDNRLRVSDLDWDLVERWASDGPRRSPERKLEWHLNEIPSALRQEYCDAFNRLGNTVPWEDMEHGEWTHTVEAMEHDAEQRASRGIVGVVLAVREADGTITGLTIMEFSRHHPEHAWQDLTAVDATVQGHGIGKWLKAEMLLHMRRERPAVRWVMTGNAGSNAPMLAINEQLGFKVHREDAGYQISRAELAQVLERVKATSA